MIKTNAQNATTFPSLELENRILLFLICTGPAKHSDMVSALSNLTFEFLEFPLGESHHL